MFRNKRQLLDNAANDKLHRLRADALTIMEAALKAVDPWQAVARKLKLLEDGLVVDGLKLPLSKDSKIIVVGGGKAGGLMAEAVEAELGDRISGGLVNVLRGTEGGFNLKKIRLNPASHPVPDGAGVNGVREMLRLVQGLSSEDVVISLISGGGSALMPMPANGISLDDLQHVTERLLKAGATINELNAVRKHLSAFKGGQLARECLPANVVSLILSDVVGDPLDTIASGPTAPDITTFETARKILHRYHLWTSLKPRVRERIELGVKGEVPETPKQGDPLFSRVHNVVVANNLEAASAASLKAAELKYNSAVLSTYVEGEARHVGTVYSSFARDLCFNNIPIDRPAAVLLGGETTVTVKGSGLGGRNQEVALSASRKIGDLDCVILALGTDGIDGPTEAAGALVDGATLNRSENLGLNIDRFLDENDSYTFFTALEDCVVTGPTGTNVNDLTLILVL
ncbi:glycerate kinase [Candidatus Bathyarchaeota archaeon]|nr:glycerate kinase [Candidatus Bathyarchaeota archaeon]